MWLGSFFTTMKQPIFDARKKGVEYVKQSDDGYDSPRCGVDVRFCAARERPSIANYWDTLFSQRHYDS